MDKRQEDFFRQRENKIKKKIVSDIENVGWSVIGVFGDIEKNEPPFSYSVGFSRMGKPEIIVVGLPLEIAQSIINEIGQRFKKTGVFPVAGDIRDDLANLPCTFIALSEQAVKERLRAATALMDPPVEALQLIWPDRQGKFPWDEGFDESMRAAQPLLGTPPLKH
ncbi:hypothetical protein GSUB_17560 (plasmid) [Geoalkalibacter subterraneus]|uniref:DUF4262 domain-containing protein n=2 Tax=Geoalkalibacter subterraneus TaxID=483547 RepID=A0A0B5FLH2_9BACT|nr:hypothetical protein GSUB_17560 [Geoalkalibacter subterraneus]